MTSRGISLIALVITVIILLILAGITITTLSGDNGILLRTAQVKKNTLIVKEQENIILDDYKNKIDKSVTGERKQVSGTNYIELTSKFKDGIAFFTYPEGYNSKNTYIVSSKAYREETNGWYERYSKASSSTNAESIVCRENDIYWSLDVSGVTFTDAKIIIMKVEN